MADESTEKKKLTWISTLIKEEVKDTEKFESNYAQITCDTEDIKDIGNADKYLFEVRRHKIKATNEEYLEVKAFEAKYADNDELEKSSDTPCAVIDKVSIVELETKLLNLRIYGILLDRKHYPKIRQLIEKTYPSISIRWDNENSTIVTVEIAKEIYGMFVAYIKDIEMEKTNHNTYYSYDIPVTEFKEYLEDTKYSKYKYADIRTKLANMGVTSADKEKAEPIKVTKCSYGRNDNTVVIGNKRIKVISFIADIVDNWDKCKDQIEG